MDKYTRTAADFLSLLGGADNAVAVAHCVTRLRITFVDRQAVDAPGLREHPAVLGFLDGPKALHLILGPAVVTEVANAFDTLLTQRSRTGFQSDG